MSKNMFIWRHKLCNSKTGVGPTFTWSNEPWSNAVWVRVVGVYVSDMISRLNTSWLHISHRVDDAIIIYKHLRHLLIITWVIFLFQIARDSKFWHNGHNPLCVTWLMSYVIEPMSYVMCHMLCVRCQVSHVSCHMSVFACQLAHVSCHMSPLTSKL